MLALTSINGKLGSATLSSILSHNLISPNSLILLTSSSTTDSKWDTIKSRGATVRSFNFSSPSPATFEGCTKLFLVSTPDISLDFNDAEAGGREKPHIATIKAAVEAGVKHVFYTSLAFGSASKAGVMRAHLRTEEYLHQLEKDRNIKITIMREGLYNESWPLYLGYYNLQSDDRKEIVLAGDGKINWTAIKDLGLATALVLADQTGRFEGKTFYLSRKEGALTLKEIAGLVGEVKGKEVRVKVVGREEYVEHYVQGGREKPDVEWWSSSYAALEEGECEIDDGTLEELLASVAVKPTPVEETVGEMLK